MCDVTALKGGIFNSEALRFYVELYRLRCSNIIALVLAPFVYVLFMKVTSIICCQMKVLLGIDVLL